MIKSGIDLITEERIKQKNKYSDANDDQYTDNSLARAAACIAMPVKVFKILKNPNGFSLVDPWPISWNKEHDPRIKLGKKITNTELNNSITDNSRVFSNEERIKLLSVSGALIAAEIDRLNRIVNNE